MCVPGLAAYLRAAAVGTSDAGPDNAGPSDTELTDNTGPVAEDRPLASASGTTTEGRA